MTLSNAAILTAYHFIIQSSTAHLDDFYEAYYSYNYGDGTILDYYAGDADLYDDYLKPTNIETPSIDKLIVTGVLVGTSFLLDLSWIFILRPEI